MMFQRLGSTLAPTLLLGGRWAVKHLRFASQRLVTSGAFGSCAGQGLAFAYLAPEYAEPGTALEVRVVEIDFKPQALQWDTGKASELTWYQAGTWHNNLAQSTSLSRQERDYVPIDHNQLLEDVYDACLPHYQAMHRHRLKA